MGEGGKKMIRSKVGVRRGDERYSRGSEGIWIIMCRQSRASCFNLERVAWEERPVVSAKGLVSSQPWRD